MSAETSIHFSDRDSDAVRIRLNKGYFSATDDLGGFTVYNLWVVPEKNGCTQETYELKLYVWDGVSIEFEGFPPAPFNPEIDGCPNKPGTPHDFSNWQWQGTPTEGKFMRICDQCSWWQPMPE